VATELRIGQLITCMHVGNLPEEVAAQNNYLFATAVIPKLRHVWILPSYDTVSVEAQDFGLG
jgi:hypothetical protein